MFFNGAERPGQRLGEKSVDRLLGEMRRRDIDIRIRAKPLRMEADKVVTERERRSPPISSCSCRGSPGRSGSTTPELPARPGGFVKADEKCRVVGAGGKHLCRRYRLPPGPDWLAKQARRLDLQAEALANIADQMAGRAPSR
ncbi:MAG: hypothetical protein R3D59_12405 [Paracoccaceae bacterium]